MMDLEQAQQSQHNYYAQQDYAHGVNSITHFDFQDSSTVPELFRNFAVEYFNLERYSRVDLEQLNAVLNQHWQGPGSAARISDWIWNIRIARRAGSTDAPDQLQNYATPTVDSELEVRDE